MADGIIQQPFLKIHTEGEFLPKTGIPGNTTTTIVRYYKKSYETLPVFSYHYDLYSGNLTLDQIKFYKDRMTITITNKGSNVVTIASAGEGSSRFFEWSTIGY